MELEDFCKAIRGKSAAKLADEVRVVDGTRFPLPSTTELRTAAIAAAAEFSGDESDAVRILADSEFDFEIVPGKDMIEQLIGVVITTSPEYAVILRDPNHPAVPAVMGALLEACPEIGSKRIVARGESPASPAKPKRIPSPQRADVSPEQDQFVRQLTAAFTKQGRKATAFGEAARWGHLTLVNGMLADGTDVDVPTEAGCTALLIERWRPWAWTLLIATNNCSSGSTLKSPFQRFRCQRSEKVLASAIAKRMTRAAIGLARTASTRLIE
jgi:hypothetical protein